MQTGELLSAAEQAMVVVHRNLMLRCSRLLFRDMRAFDACTDVTGFSRGDTAMRVVGDSGLTVVIDSSKVPFLPGAGNMLPWDWFL